MSLKLCLILIISCINFVAYGSDISSADQNIFQKYAGMDSAFIRDSVISDLKRRKEIRTSDQMISSLYLVDYTLLEKKMLQMEECEKSKRRFLKRFKKSKCDSVINVNLFPQLPLQLLFDSYHSHKFDSNDAEGIRAYYYHRSIFCHLKERFEMSSSIGFSIITPLRDELIGDTIVFSSQIELSNDTLLEIISFRNDLVLAYTRPLDFLEDIIWHYQSNLPKSSMSINGISPGNWNVFRDTSKSSTEDRPCFTFMSISVDSSSNHVGIAVPNNVNCSIIHPQSSDSMLIVKSNSFYAEIRFLNDTCATVVCNGENEQVKTHCKMIRTSPFPTVKNWCY